MRSSRSALEIMAWLLGFGLFAAYGASAYWSSLLQDKGVAEFAKIRWDHSPARVAPASSPVNTVTVPDSAINMSAWSPNRIDAYRDRTPSSRTPEAVLRIPDIDLIVPVYPGTSEATLNRGAGRIEGTPRFGEWGNTAVAAHRDGFFRGLMHVQRGDVMHLELPHGTYTYQVVSLRIVDPSETSVLNDSFDPMITLVTCYPFYFVGPAPKRFIVHATRVAGDATRAAPPRPAIPRASWRAGF